MGIEQEAQISPESRNEREQILGEYGQQMETYQRITKRVRSLERRYPPDSRDKAISFDILETDKDRHQNHLRLIETAKKLGKSKEDVLVDIIRWENSLQEYDLPEFSILKSSDIVDMQGFHSGIQFNIYEDERRPAPPTPLDRVFGDYELGEETYGGVAERVFRVFPEYKILIVFSINPIGA